MPCDATTYADNTLWNTYEELEGRQLTSDDTDRVYAVEWNRYFNDYNSNAALRNRVDASSACIGTEPRRFVLQGPVFKSGGWYGFDGKKLKSIKYGDTAIIKVETKHFEKNFPTDRPTRVKITIKDRDPLYTWDDKLGEVEAEVINNKLAKVIQFKEEWYNRELDNQNEIYFEISVECRGKTIKAKFPKKDSDYLIVSQAPIRLYITRKYHWPKVPLPGDPRNDTDDGNKQVRQGATISEYKLKINGRTKQKGYMLEAAGDSTTTANTDQRIKPGVYNLIENPGGSNYTTSSKYPLHRFRLVQRDESKVLKTFGNRSLINIHAGYKATEIKGCLAPMPGYKIYTSDSGHPYPKGHPNEWATTPTHPTYREFAKMITDFGCTVPCESHDGGATYPADDRFPLYYNVLVIINEDFNPLPSLLTL